RAGTAHPQRGRHPGQHRPHLALLARGVARRLRRGADAARAGPHRGPRRRPGALRPCGESVRRRGAARRTRRPGPMIYVAHHATTLARAVAGAWALTRGRWQVRAPRLALLLWHATAISAVTGAVGLLLSVGLQPYRLGIGPALGALVTGAGRPAPLTAAHLGAVAAGLALGAAVLAVQASSSWRLCRQRSRHRLLLRLVGRPEPRAPPPAAGAVPGPAPRPPGPPGSPRRRHRRAARRDVRRRPGRPPPRRRPARFRAPPFPRAGRPAGALGHDRRGGYRDRRAHRPPPRSAPADPPMGPVRRDAHGPGRRHHPGQPLRPALVRSAPPYLDRRNDRTADRRNAPYAPRTGTDRPRRCTCE